MINLGLRDVLLPRDKKFFDLLTQESQNVVEGADALRDMMNDFRQKETKYHLIRDLEHKGDGIVHIIFEKLDKALITPIDHEDLSKLASNFDDVIDGICSVAKRVILYEIPEPTLEMGEFAELIVQSVNEVNTALKVMQKFDQEQIEKHCIETDRLENLADDLLNKAVARLFKTNDPIQILKFKEIYEKFEETTDRCEDVTDVMHDIVLKNA
ncbi:MAG: DUF47 family protein [Thaumarchaeota archaeon]|nr:DUF47 family protein [Nitrososphaerota archaeon]